MQPRVPAGDGAHRVQHVDCVVGYAFDEQTKPLLARLQCFFRRSPLCQVACNLGKTDQRASRIADGIDNDAGPKPPAILAHAPSFGLEPAVPFRCFEGESGNARRLIFRRVKAGKMLADDFIGFIALESPSASIPADDRAIGRKHVDCVISNALDKQFEAVSRDLRRRRAHKFPILFYLLESIKHSGWFIVPRTRGCVMPNGPSRY